MGDSQTGCDRRDADHVTVPAQRARSQTNPRPAHDSHGSVPSGNARDGVCDGVDVRELVSDAVAVRLSVCGVCVAVSVVDAVAVADAVSEGLALRVEGREVRGIIGAAVGSCGCRPHPLGDTPVRAPVGGYE